MHGCSPRVAKLQKKCQIDKFEPFFTPVYDKMKKFIDEREKTKIDTVLITGGTGVGKTHLVGCMTTYALDKGVVIKFATAFNFNQDMLKYHCSKLEEKNDVIEPYLNSDILFIDDLGAENKIQNVTNEYLYLIINERMMNHKKTYDQPVLIYELHMGSWKKKEDGTFYSAAEMAHMLVDCLKEFGSHQEKYSHNIRSGYYDYEDLKNKYYPNLLITPDCANILSGIICLPSFLVITLTVVPN
mgnify:CR=1 FL=1